MAEDFYDQAGEDFDGGEDGPDLRQVLRNGSPYAVFDENGEAMPSQSAPVNSNVWGSTSNPWGVGVALDPDLGFDWGGPEHEALF